MLERATLIGGLNSLGSIELLFFFFIPHRFAVFRCNNHQHLREIKPKQESNELLFNAN